MTEFVTLDSGSREEFITGSRRDSAKGKGRFDLIPYDAELRLAQLYERGADKYSDNNWLLGQPFSHVMSSMLRHARKAAADWQDEDHLAAVAWNAFALMTFEEMIKRGELPPELDDIRRINASRS